MLIRCPSCGERSSDDAGFCSGCGAALLVLAPSARIPATSATGAAVKLAAPPEAAASGTPARRASISPRALPVAGLIFTVLFVFGLAHWLARGESGGSGS